MPSIDTVIDTGRLLLRRFTTDDLDAFYELGSRPAIIRYAQAMPLASRKQALEFMQAAPFRDYATYAYWRFACVWKTTGEVIGFSGVTKLGFSVEKKLRYSGLPGIDIDLFARNLVTPCSAAAVP